MLGIIKKILGVLIISLIAVWLGINYRVYKEMEQLNLENDENAK